VEARVTVGLFRDLDETIYIAACPLLSEKEPADPGAPNLEEMVESDDWKSCLDLAPGQTFSAEIESREARLVIDGRQLPLRIFATIFKDRRIDTPYVPRKSRPLPRVSVAPGTAARETTEGPEPSLPLPDIDTLSAGQPSASPSARKSAKPMGNAATDLPTGRLMITCSSSRARVFVDRAHVGACPFDSSVVAGRHSVRVEQPGREPFEAEVTVVAGKATEARVPQ
jgi:hypothetical protein